MEKHEEKMRQLVNHILSIVSLVAFEWVLLSNSKDYGIAVPRAFIIIHVFFHRRARKKK